MGAAPRLAPETEPPRDELLPVRSCLEAIGERYARADARKWSAQVWGDQPGAEAAEAERRAALEEYGAIARDWAALWALLFRFAAREGQLGGALVALLRAELKANPDALRQLLAEALGPELTDLAGAVARLERRR